MFGVADNGLYIAAIVPFDGCRYSDIYLLSNDDMNKVMQSNPIIIDSVIDSVDIINYADRTIDLTDEILIEPSAYRKVSANTWFKTITLRPIIYEDETYSYSSLNLICIGDDVLLAPLEAIESFRK